MVALICPTTCKLNLIIRINILVFGYLKIYIDKLTFQINLPPIILYKAMLNWIILPDILDSSIHGLNDNIKMDIKRIA
jgi:hypothetical protein